MCPLEPRRRRPVAAEPTTIIGSYISPYVRKVLVCLDLKGIDYRVDPIVPFYGGDEFAAVSPVRRIPVLIDDRATLCDSTVICEYLEERYPRPSLFPSAPETRARARWLEEFADTRMGDVFIWRFFNEIVIKRFVWREETDTSVVERTLTVDVPAVLDYLERELPGEESYLFGAISVADIAIAAFFRNAGFAGFEIDAGRWPVTARFVGRVLGQPSFTKLYRFEDLMLRTPIPKQRDALLAAGAPVTEKTFGTDTPRRGVLPT
jgi:glutathione S-transferase